jgi:RNA polymerase sigma-70 factor (ECF subfamily)
MHALQPFGAPAPAIDRRSWAAPRRPRPTDGARRVSEPAHADLIVAIARRADRAAFAALFAFFAPRVKAWMLRAGATDGRAEDLAQETMLAVWRKAALYDPAKAAPATWIFAIARNRRIDAMRRERHPDEWIVDPSEEPELPEPPDSALGATERQSRIRAALSALPEEQAEVVRLAYFEDKPHSEIERDLGIPLGTVKSRLRLAMGRLRAALGDLA